MESINDGDLLTRLEVNVSDFVTRARALEREKGGYSPPEVVSAMDLASLTRAAEVIGGMLAVGAEKMPPGLIVAMAQTIGILQTLVEQLTDETNWIEPHQA